MSEHPQCKLCHQWHDKWKDCPKPLVHNGTAPVVHKERKPKKYQSPDARKAYRRKWMKDKRASTKLATEAQ